MDVVFKSTLTYDLFRGAQALPFLMEEAQTGSIDMAIQVGDFAYDMHQVNIKTDSCSSG